MRFVLLGLLCLGLGFPLSASSAGPTLRLETEISVKSDSAEWPGRWVRLAIDARGRTAYLATIRGLFTVSLLSGADESRTSRIHWSEQGAPEACTGGTLAVFDLAFLGDRLLVRNLATSLLHEVIDGVVGDPIPKTRLCGRMASLDAETLVCAHPASFDGRRTEAIELRDARSMKPRGRFFPTSSFGKREELVDQIHVASTARRIFACHLLSTSIAVFDEKGLHVAEFDFADDGFVPVGERMPSDWPDLNPREARRAWFRSWTPVNNLIAGEDLVGIQYYLGPDTNRLVLLDARSGKTVLRTDGAFLEAILGDRLVFSDRRSLIQVFRLVGREAATPTAEPSRGSEKPAG